MDQYLRFKELGLVVIIQLRTFIVTCYTLSLVLMGEDSETEPAVEVTDPAVPAVQQDLKMMALIKANNFMDTYFDPDW